MSEDGFPLLAAELGATVINADLKQSPRTNEAPTDDLIEQRGGTAVYVETDVTELKDLMEAADRAEQMGG